MNYPFRCVLLTLGILIVSTSALAQAGRADRQVWQSAEVRSESWLPFASPDGRFTVLFPGIPTVSEQVVDQPGIRFVLRKTQLRTFAEYGVIYADYPKSVTDNSPADVLLDEGAKGGVAEVNSQLLSISPISVGGYPGRLMKERMPGGQIMQVKVVLAGQRLYQVAITTPREDGADPATVGLYNSIATKFLDSFQITYDTQERVLGAATCPPDEQNCVAITDAVLNARALSLPKPAYPPIARAAHATGKVNVRVLIDEQGVVVSASAISGHPLLQAAAVAAARSARFAPNLVDNRPVRVAGVIQYSFLMD